MPVTKLNAVLKETDSQILNKFPKQGHKSNNITTFQTKFCLIPMLLTATSYGNLLRTLKTIIMLLSTFFGEFLVIVKKILFKLLLWPTHNT